MVIPANSEGDQDGNNGTDALNQVGGLHRTPFGRPRALAPCHFFMVIHVGIRRLKAYAIICQTFRINVGA